ncbi:MAG TPA: hypothetical protein P5511_02635 [Candidatus Goldiibacteriota bacterium]|nr:hypothetical protein [Candidatus Goldiibacteriota bacterium]
MYQDREYSAQLAIKRKETEEAFGRAGVMLPSGTEGLRIYVKDEYYYRNRMDFAFNSGGLGLREKGKFSRLVGFEECHISNNVINRLLGEVNSWYRGNRDRLEVFDVVKRKGTLRYAVCRGSFFSGDSSITFVLNRDSENIESHAAAIREFAAASSAANVLFGTVKYNTDISSPDDCVVVKGSDCLHETLAGIKYTYHTQGFFQNNSLVTMDMMHFIRSKIAKKYPLILDLFGGVGTFGIFCADKADEVIISDNSGPSAACAERNIRENRKMNAIFRQADATEPEKLSPWLAGKGGLYIVDPPRTGLHKKTIKFLRTMKPEKIIYVSCNQIRLAEDIRDLSEIYELKDLALFDMFPQARHIESVAELDLKK